MTARESCGGQSDPITAWVAVRNRAPQAATDTYLLWPETTLVVPAAGVFADDRNDAIGTPTVRLGTPPDHGSVTLAGDGGFVYGPPIEFMGTATFTYIPSDGYADGDSTTVTVTDEAFLAAADAYPTGRGETLTVGAAGGVLGNDRAAGGTATVESGPAHGTLTLHADGSFVYAPTAGYVGTDSFTYKASDGAEWTGPVTVTLDVWNLDHRANPDSYRAHQRQSLTPTTGVRFNDYDDGDTLTATRAAGPSHGTLQFNANGTFTYTPTAGFVGTDSFSYSLDDGAGPGGAGAVAVAVWNNAPTGHDNHYSVKRPGVLVVGTDKGVLWDDADWDGDALRAVLLTQPKKGALTFNPNGSFRYDPDDTQNGTDTFTYLVTDGVTATGPPTVSIDIENLAPYALDDTRTVLHDSGPITFNILDNDWDLGNESFWICGFTQPSAAGFSTGPGGQFDPGDGNVTFTPPEHWDGEASFRYTVTDGALESTSVTVRVVVRNTPPAGVTDTYQVKRGCNSKGTS